MKVIATDFRARVSVSDRVIRENLEPAKAERIVRRHNAKLTDDADWFYVVKEDDYELYEAKSAKQEEAA